MMPNSAKFLLIPLIVALVIPLAFAHAESASEQFQNGIPINEIQCDSPDHILVERNNGNPACVTERTAEKLGWEPIIQESHPAKSPQIVDDTPTDEIVSISTQNDNLDLLLFPSGDPDEFAQELATYANDVILNKTIRPSGAISYETQKGSIRLLSTDNDHGYGGFKYQSYPHPITPIGQSEQFLFGLLDELGIVLDGTELIRPLAYYDDPYHFIFMQKHDGMFITSSKIVASFEPGYSYIKVRTWIVNPHEMNLYDPDMAIEIAKNHALEYNVEEESPDCNRLEYLRTHENYTTPSIIIKNGIPIYKIYVGDCPCCHLHALTGSSHNAFVNALTGEFLSIKKGLRM